MPTMIGKLNTRIVIKKRNEIGDFSDPFFDPMNPFGQKPDPTTGNQENTIEYETVYETWADANYTSAAKKFNGRAVGNQTGDSGFIIRNVDFEIEKDFYIDAKGYRYQVKGTMPADDKFRFLFLDCIFIGRVGDDG